MALEESSGENEALLIGQKIISISSLSQIKNYANESIFVGIMEEIFNLPLNLTR